MASITSQLTEDESENIFDSNIFLKIKKENFLYLEQYKKFELAQDQETKVYGFNLGDELFLRPLRRDDFKRCFLDLLIYLSEVESSEQITKEQYEKRFDEMAKARGTYYTFVIVDKTKDILVGTLTNIFERKFIFRNTGALSRIRNIAVHEEYRGKKLCKIMMDVAIQLSRELGCYKVSLECEDELKNLYCKFGLKLGSDYNYLSRDLS